MSLAAAARRRVPERAAQDFAHHKAWGDVTIDLLKQLDVKVDFAAVDFGTVVARRTQKSPPRNGGWQMFITSYYGADFADPTKRFLRANGNELSNGWSNNPQIEAETAACRGQLQCMATTRQSAPSARVGAPSLAGATPWPCR